MDSPEMASSNKIEKEESDNYSIFFGLISALKLFKDKYLFAGTGNFLSVFKIKGKEHLKLKIKIFESEKDFENFKGFIKMPFCETLECENNIKQKYAFTTRCIPFENSSISPELPDSTCPICGKKAKNYVYFAKAY